MFSVIGTVSVFDFQKSVEPIVALTRISFLVLMLVV